MTPDPDEARATLVADHHPVCKWSHYPDASNACVGECDYACACDGENWPCATAELLAELDQLRSSVAAVRALHRIDERRAQWGHEVCAGCATHVTFTPWPCATIKALDLAVSGLGHIPGKQP